MILGTGVAVFLFTFVGTSRGHLCDSTAFLLDISENALALSDFSRVEKLANLPLNMPCVSMSILARSPFNLVTPY